MRKLPRLALFLALLCPATAWADPPKITGNTTVPPYKLVRLTAEGVQAKAGLLWKVKPLDGQDPAAIDFCSARNAKHLVFVAPPGRYSVELTVGNVSDTGFELDGTDTVVTIGVAPVDPILPTDPFVAAIAAAYKAEDAADKLASVKRLATIYRAAATTTVKDESIKTCADLVAVMKAASHAFPECADGKIPAVRKAIGERLNKSLGNPTAPIDRALAAKEVLAVAAALEALK